MCSLIISNVCFFQWYWNYSAFVFYLSSLISFLMVYQGSELQTLKCTLPQWITYKVMLYLPSSILPWVWQEKCMSCWKATTILLFQLLEESSIIYSKYFVTIKKKTQFMLCHFNISKNFKSYFTDLLKDQHEKFIW